MCLGHRSSDQQKTGVKPTHMRHAESTFRWMGAEWASQCETTRCGVDRHRFLGRKQNRFGSELNVAHAYLSRRCWPLKFLNCSTPHPYVWAPWFDSTLSLNATPSYASMQNSQSLQALVYTTNGNDEFGSGETLQRPLGWLVQGCSKMHQDMPGFRYGQLQLWILWY